MIKVEHYTKSYGKFVAVQDLSFHVESGQILGLLGPNGAGKTTTLRALVGVLQPTQGRLSVAGYDLEKEPLAAKREIAYVPDDPKLFDALTAWEHLVFTAQLYQVKDLDQRGTELLKEFDLLEKKNTVAQELSRGMRQKLAICCAYLHDPKAILLDEPMTGLDPLGIRTLKESVAERARAGAAVVVSSHLLALIEDLCTHLLIIDRGKAKFFGPKEMAKEYYGDVSGGASLEEVYFRATEQDFRPQPEIQAEVLDDPINPKSSVPDSSAAQADSHRTEGAGL